MSLPATKRPPKDFKELQWQEQQNWQQDKKTHGSSKKSKHPPPKAITLPFYQGTNNNFSKYVEVAADGGFGSKIGHMRVKKTKPIIPGWLVELKDHFLRGVMDVKSILEEGSQDVSVVDIVASLAKVINEDMEIEISDIEIFKILKKIPRDCDGYFSFPHFMYGMGNPTMATEKGVFMRTQRKFDGKTENIFNKKANKANEEDEQSCGDQKRQESREKDEYDGEDGEEGLESESKECLEKPKKVAESNIPDETGYSLREKVFFSGLLIFEMYETLKEVENLYALSKIPEPAGIEEERNRKRGFGQENIGNKNPKEAAWDKPLPELPKLSPYLSSVPFVTTRWNTSKPGPHAKLKRTWSKLQPLHLAIRPPRKLRHPICITENQARVRQALAYLAAMGDCVALLPDIHFVIHLSDTDVDKLEVVTIRDDPEDAEEEAHHSAQDRYTEKQFILQEAQKLYRPHQLPNQITKLTSTITYTDGLQLREIVKFMQQDHWKCISQKKLEFREKVWVRMHVDEMPFGRMRDSYIYAFVTYLPYVSHLPVLNSTVRPHVGRHCCICTNS